jgi:hypothetical protein
VHVEEGGSQWKADVHSKTVRCCGIVKKSLRLAFVECGVSCSVEFLIIVGMYILYNYILYIICIMLYVMRRLDGNARRRRSVLGQYDSGTFT